MPKYRVHLTATASTSVEVEAADESDAVEKAVDENPAYLCHQCSRQVDLGDFDLNVGVGERESDYIEKIED